MTQVNSSQSPAYPEIIDSDLTCIGCGYNLRGLLGKSVCPECAKPIVASVEHRELTAAGIGVPLTAVDPRWVRALGEGCAILVFSALGKACISATRAHIWRAGAGITTVLFIVAVALNVADAVGLWKLASPEIPEAPPQRRWLPRVLRALALTSLGWFVMRLTVPMGTFNTAMLVFGVRTAIDAAVTWLAWHYLNRLSQRMQSPSLSWQAGAVGWLLSVSLVLELVVGYPTGGGSRAVVGDLQHALRLLGLGPWIASGAPMLATATVSPWGALLLVVFAVRFFRIAKAADQRQS